MSKDFGETRMSVDYTMTDSQPTRADRVYEWIYSFIGGLLLLQIWLIVIAVALFLPVMGIVGLILLVRDLI